MGGTWFPGASRNAPGEKLPSFLPLMLPSGSRDARIRVLFGKPAFTRDGDNCVVARPRYSERIASGEASFLNESKKLRSGKVQQA